MLIVLSPAKSLDFEPVTLKSSVTEPRLTSDTAKLATRTKKLSRAEIRKLMKLSEDLADLNYERYQSLASNPSPNDAKAALFAFNGDVYRGLAAKTLSDAAVSRAQTQLRILSGFYGLLRPLDLIHPYRLEMGTRLDTQRGSNLYEFWGSRIAKLLNEDLKSSGGPLINLASKEYSSAIDRKALKTDIIEVSFKEEKDGKLRILSFYAKYARGLMARWALEQNCKQVDDLKRFDVDGYSFSAEASTDKHLVFTRPQPAPKS